MKSTTRAVVLVIERNENEQLFMKDQTKRNRPVFIKPYVQNKKIKSTAGNTKTVK